MRGGWVRILLLHAVVLGALFAAQFFLAPYHYTNVARIMVLATFAIGFNVLFGYTGLMSLGHAMFFAVGMYTTGMTVYYLEWTSMPALAAGVAAGACFAAVFGSFALRTSGVSFLIVTMMFGQALYLTILYFNEYTFGDQGFSLSSVLPALSIGGREFAFSEPVVKYNGAWLVFFVALSLSLLLAASPIGRVLIGLRENEERARMLGYNTFRYKLLALVVSGAIAAGAGAAYALLFSYVGASFASILYSIYPLLWTLLGGAGTTLGPLLGTGLMYYLIDVASEWTSAYLFIVGGALVVLVLWFPEGILGTVRKRWLRWLP
ncbi:MAG: branched-chain amino acid ABC transporter permease [Gammaproteobacteria bacterium]|nr:branched-chain amino acid ABC transporter permease [Gammaproteobacteria bacterium]